MISAANRIPNFAGVALVDILANGVAVLIIVIVLSIAARTEQEKRYTEQVKEVSTVMTREFSTNLVLNRLAASPPAQLHDYVNSAFDLFWDPYLMPVIEFHSDFIRDPYTATIWPKSELLKEPNSLDTWLESFSEEQKLKVRGDFYDIGSFYLAMSILREHNIPIVHWHFIGAASGSIVASACPAGVSAADCRTGGGGTGSNALAELMDSIAGQSTDGRGTSENGGSGNQWPPSRLDENGDVGSSQLGGDVPSGTSVGGAAGGPTRQQGGNSGWNSFPDSRSFQRRQSGGQGDQPGDQGAQRGSPKTMLLRLADPNSLNVLEDGEIVAFDFDNPFPLLKAVMTYLTQIQHSLDKEQPPTSMLNQLMTYVQFFLSQDIQLDSEQQQIVEDIAFNLRNDSNFANNRPNSPISVLPLDIEGEFRDVIRLIPNRPLYEVEVRTSNTVLQTELPTQSLPRLNLNAYPDIYRGLKTSLERGTILMMPPTQNDLTKPRWRVIAQLSPRLDDLIVGFVYSTVDENGRLLVFGESNMVRIGTFKLLDSLQVKSFGTKTWLLVFYVALGVLFAGLLLFWRPGTRARQ